MGNGIYGSLRPPESEHAPYIEVYKAAGGWQSHCVFWAGQHWDVWDTGNGPYGYEAEARADATAWANDWGFELRLPDRAPERERAPGLLDNPTILSMAARGALFLKCVDGESRSSPPRKEGESDEAYRDRLLAWSQGGFRDGA